MSVYLSSFIFLGGACFLLFQVKPLGAQILGVDTDHHGMIPQQLRHVLSRWKPSDAQNKSSDIPKLLYTIPNGVNPTGASLTLARKKEIYEVREEKVPEFS